MRFEHNVSTKTCRRNVRLQNRPTNIKIKDIACKGFLGATYYHFNWADGKMSVLQQAEEGTIGQCLLQPAVTTVCLVGL